MKYIYTILVALLVVVSCKNTTKSQIEEAEIEAGNRAVAVPVSLTNLYTPNDGVLRGIDFSAARNEIMSTEEPANLRKNGGNELQYTIDLNNTDFADVMYFFKNDQLYKIQVDIFGEDEAASNQLYEDAKAFFNAKYKNRKLLWEGSEHGKTYTIFAKQVKNGIYIVYELI